MNFLSHDINFYSYEIYFMYILDFSDRDQVMWFKKWPSANIDPVL
jgi:hypothetical protein